MQRGVIAQKHTLFCLWILWFREWYGNALSAYQRNVSGRGRHKIRDAERAARRCETEDAR